MRQSFGDVLKVTEVELRKAGGQLAELGSLQQVTSCSCRSADLLQTWCENLLFIYKYNAE